MIDPTQVQTPQERYEYKQTLARQFPEAEKEGRNYRLLINIKQISGQLDRDIEQSLREIANPI